MLQWFSIVVLSILACVTYGVLHDQITTRVCVEYFTIGHPKVIPSTDPTVLGIVWGVLATWWVGAILGGVLATVARLGSRPKRSVGSLLRPVAILFLATAFLALSAGLAGYLMASSGRIKLGGRLAVAVPREQHTPFLADLWAHTASYAGGFVGGTVLIVSVWRSRRGPNSYVGESLRDSHQKPPSRSD